jgi:hypothetical protein
MTAQMIDPLVAWGIQLYQTFPFEVDTSKQNDAHEPWLAYVQAVSASMASGSLTTSSMTAIAAIASNVHKSASFLSTMDQDWEVELASLTDKVSSLAMERSDSEYQCIGWS